MNAAQPATATSGAGRKALLIGIGNCARRDDGLGWAFLDRIRQSSIFDGDIEYRYQLQIEDAAMISQAERVIFVDSFDGDLPGGFRLDVCEPSGSHEFTSHALAPQAVLALCQALYGTRPRAEVLMIKGSEWGLDAGMSQRAERNLESALQHFRDHWRGA